MELRIKGFLRSAAAGLTSISVVSRYAIFGIVGVALVVLAFGFIRQAQSDPFVITQVDDSVETDSTVGSDIAVAGEVSEEKKIAVHVGGCVAAPGVVEVRQGARVIDCVEEAGGFLLDANRDGVNLAAFVQDGQRIVIPAVGEAIPSSVIPPSSGQVNINTAGVEELCTLDGIGEVLAKRIIAYRDKIGGFTSLGQLTGVSGIGAKRLEAIKDDICL